MKIAESKKDRFKGQLSKGLPKFFLYALLIIIAYVFIYPLMLMFATSLKSLYDQIDPLVIWLPKNIYWENYRRAWVALGGTDTYLMSIFNIGIIALVQTISAAIIAYGIAKFDYWWTKLAFFIIVITFIFPQELFFLAQYPPIRLRTRHQKRHLYFRLLCLFPFAAQGFGRGGLY